MNTVISWRKTPHVVKKDIFGDKFIATIRAQCFEFGNKEDRVVYKVIPLCQCYVKPGRQHIPDYELTIDDVRPYHVDVWNAKSTNMKKHGMFLTDYEIDAYVTDLYIYKKEAEKNEQFFKQFME